jgi:hypothetical protein
MQRFRSKIDAWLVAALGLTAAVLSTAVVAMLRGGVPVLAVIPAAGLGLVAWMMTATWYGLDETSLVVRSGPMRMEILLATIRAIRPTRSMLSAPALSLDRLEIQCDRGGVVVSPLDKAGFIQAIQARAPHVRVEGNIAAPGRSVRLGWGLLIMPVGVLAVVGLLLSRSC